MTEAQLGVAAYQTGLYSVDVEYGYNYTRVGRRYFMITSLKSWGGGGTERLIVILLFF